jgi:hypothetical protein
MSVPASQRTVCAPKRMHGSLGTRAQFQLGVIHERRAHYNVFHDEKCP